MRKPVFKTLAVLAGNRSVCLVSLTVCALREEGEGAYLSPLPDLGARRLWPLGVWSGSEDIINL